VIVQAHASGNEPLATHARLRRVEARVHTGRAHESDVIREAETAIRFFSIRDDHRGLAHAWALVGRARFWLGAARESEEAYEHAVESARRSGDLRRETETLAWWIGAVAHGPAPASAGITFCDAVLARGLNDPLIDIFALEKRGLLEAMQGRFEAARASVSGAQRIADELDLQVRRGMCREYAGRVELLAGDMVAAEHELRAGYDLLGSLGESAFRASIGGYLAEALYQQDRLAEGAAMLEGEDPETDALRGKILARSGDLERGERIARRAVESLKTSDYLDARAKASMDLAAVLGLAQRFTEAADAITDAVRLYEQKGNTVSAEAARDSLRAQTH